MVATSFSTVFIGMISCIACDSAMYLASIVDKAISVCSFDIHSTGQLVKVIT